MARTLAELQKQYNSSASHSKPGGMPPMGGPGRGPGRGGPPGAMVKSKPKNTKDTVKRLLKYVKKYSFHILFVAFCMLVSTVTNLIGSFMLAPIINKITFYVAPSIASLPLQALPTKFSAVLPLLSAVTQKQKFLLTFFLPLQFLFRYILWALLQHIFRAE